ncbi:MAG: hypothetical protein HS104_31620 [Polyangiaceae bacterium]|nr:hypothetical protein [Polyangiaceae bacterium]MCL4749036.1 hypothetical protein [Myxococcales bacterium]
MTLRHTFWVWGWLFVAGCGPYVDEVVKQRGPAVEQRLALVRGVSEELARTPLLDKDEPADVKASFNMKSGYPDAANAVLVYAEDLRELDELGLVYARVDGTKILNTCSAFVHTERYPWDPLHPDDAPLSGTGYTANKHFDVCEKLDFLFVLRTRAFVRPSIGRDAGGRQEFDGGFVGADLLVFDLAQKKKLGGLRVQAESAEKLEGATAFEVEFDLQWNLQQALQAALKQHMPNVTVLGGSS